MTRGHYRIAKAAKDRACTERSWHTIRKGELYLSAACPPEHEANMGRKWWRISACLKCAESFGMHTSETRKQLEARTPEAGRVTPPRDPTPGGGEMTDDDADELQGSYDHHLESAVDAVLGDEGEPCYACGGEGEYHDCGEDTCCCADPETQYMYDCEECNGTGRL